MTIREKGRESDILQAASRIFTSKGFHKTTIEEIAEAAGIGKSTVYEYFKNKDELFLKMLEYTFSAYHNLIEERLKSYSSFMDKLHGFIDLHETITRENIQSVSFMIESGTLSMVDSDTKKQTCGLMLDSRNTVITILSRILAQGRREMELKELDSDFAADIFYSMVIRSCVRLAMGNYTGERASAEKSMLVNLFMDGIK